MHFWTLLITTLIDAPCLTHANSIPWPNSIPPTNWTAPVTVPLNSSLRNEFLWKFAPIVYLHPEEAYLPSDPKSTFKKYYNSTADEIWVPHEKLAGEAAQVKSDGTRFVDAPMTAQARILPDGRVALQYWYYHHFNGAQGFKTITRSGEVTRFPWYPLAVHYADWEHTTIVLRSVEDARIESVYYTVHADINEPEYAYPVVDDTHAVVYSHNNSHACYKTPDDVQNTDPAFDGFINSAVRAITFGAITHVEVGDIGFSNFPKNEWIKWTPREIYDVTADNANSNDIASSLTGQEEFIAWKGHWGPSFDQSQVDMPPLQVPWRRFFFSFLQMLYHAGRLTKFVTPAKISPRGPAMHYTYLTFDVYDPPPSYVPEDPNGHKPNFFSIAGFIYLILGFLGILIAILSLLLVALLIFAKSTWTKVKKSRDDRRRRRNQMTERTPLLS